MSARNLILIACVSSCNTYPQPTQDATTREIPPPDCQLIGSCGPADPREPGCGLGQCIGNLPTSRTLTLNKGDEIPSDLINEIQDQLVLDRRTTYTKMVFPRQIGGTGWASIADRTAVGVARPAITSTRATNNGEFEIPIESGEQLIGFSMFAAGNNVSDLDGSVNYVPSFPSDSGIFGLFAFQHPDTPDVWTEIVGSVISPAPPVAVGSTVIIAPDVNGPGYSIGMFKLTFRRTGL